MKINLEVLESMIYYWSSVSERVKLGEKYLTSISDHKMMQPIYSDDFNQESVRKVLSAISNREPFKGKNKSEGRFWNNNMWMLEDMDYMNMIITPLKKLNLSSIREEANSKYEVVFLPLHLDTYYKEKNKLYINFFLVKPDLYNDTDILKIEDIELKEWIRNKFE